MRFFTQSLLLHPRKLLLDLLPLFLLLGALIAAGPLRAQTTFTHSAGFQNWTDPAAWTKSGTATAATYPGEIGGETHDVVISADQITIAAALNSNSVRNVTVTGTLLVNAATVFSNTGGSMIGGGTTQLESTLSTGGNYAVTTTSSTGGGILQVAKAISTSSTSGNVALVYTGSITSALTLSGSFASLSSTAGTLTSSSSYTLTQSLNLGGNYTQTTGTITFTGTSLAGTGTIVLPTLVLNSSSSIANTLTATLKGDLTQSGSGALASTGGRITFDKGNTMTLGGSGTGAITLFNMTVGGTASSYLTVTRSITVAGTANGSTANTAALGINSATNDVLALAAGNTLSVTGTGASLLTNARLDGASTATYEINADNVSIKDATVFSKFSLATGRSLTTDQSITVKYGVLTNSGTTFLQTAGTFTLGTGSQSVTGTGSFTTNHLTVTGGGTKTISLPITVGGDMTIAASNLVSLAANDLTVKGSYTNSGTLSQSGTGKVIFAGTAAQALSGTLTFRNLSVTNTTAVVSAASAVTVSVNTIIASGATLSVPSVSQSLGTVSGSPLGGTLQITAAASANTVFPTGTFTQFLGSAGQGTVEYTGAAAYNVYDVPPTGYWNLKISGAGVKTLTQAIEVHGDIAIASGATLNGGTVNITLFDGGITNNGTFDGGNNGDVRLSSTTADQSLTGTGVYNFQQLTMAKSGKAVVLGQNIRVDVKLNFETDGFMDLGAYNLTIGPNSSILTNTSFGLTCMIRQNGSATGGAVVREGTATTTFISTIPIGTAGVYAPIQFTQLTATITGTASISMRTVPNTIVGNSNYLKRFWRITTTGISAVTNARFNFTYPSGEVVGTPNQVVRRDGGGTPYDPTGAFYDGISKFGINSSGNTFLEQDWSFEKLDLAIIYYSFQNGNYSDPNTWTTDYNGVTWTNPPDAGGPDANDKIVILAGKTVTVDVNNTSPDSVQIRSTGLLILGTTTGHNFGIVEGQGTLRSSTGTLPVATYASLVQVGGGTVEYTNFTGTIDAGQNSYCHLIFSGTGTKTISATAARTVTVNGNLSVTGTSQLTIGSAAFAITLPITGSMTVTSTASVRVAAFNVGHTVRIGGSFTTAGDVRFHNLTGGPTLTHYTTLTTTGYATVEMINAGTASISISVQECSFYYLRINKSVITDVVTLTPTRRSFFTIYGQNNQADAGIDVPAALCTKALRPDVGTLVLDDSVVVASLTEGTNWFRIGAQAELRIRGKVTITTAAATLKASEIATYGKLRVQGNGKLFGGTGGGVRLVYTGQFIVEAGTVTLSQLCTYRSSGLGAPSGTFSVSGGTLIFDGSGVTDLNFARFDILWSSLTCAITGGTFNIYNPVGTATSVMKNGGVRINSSTTTSTGGTWNLYLPATADANQNFGLSVSSTLWLVNMYNLGTYTSSNFVASSMAYADNGNTGTIAARAFTVSTSLVQNAYCVLDANAQQITIGANWSVASTGGFIPNGTSQLTRFGEGIAGQGTLCTVSLNYASPTFSMLEFNNNASGSAYTFSGNDITCNNDLRFYSGTINHGGVKFNAYKGYDCRVNCTGPGRVIMLGTTSESIYGNSSGYTYELEIRKTPTSGVYPTVTLQTAQVQVRYKLILTSGIIETGGQQLYVIGGCHIYNGSGDSAQGAFGVTNMITTNSTKALIRGFSATFKSLVWPIGSGTSAGGNLKYRPVLSSVTSATTYGYANFIAYGSQHPNITVPPATTDDALNYYWNVGSGGWSGLTGVSVTFVYNASDIPPSGNTNGDAAYVLGRYIYATPNYWTTSTYTTQAADVATTSMGTAFNGGDYTVGNVIAFGGLIEYWCRVTSGSWGVPSTWRRKQAGVWLDNTPAYSATIPQTGSAVVIPDNMTVTIKDSVSTISLATLNLQGANTVLEMDTTLSKWAHNFGTVLASSAKINLSYGKLGVRVPGGNWTAFFAANSNYVTFYRKGYDYQIPKKWTAAYRYLTLKPDGGKITLPDTLLNVNQDFAISNTTAGKVYVSSAAGTNGDLYTNVATTIGAQAQLIFPATVSRTWKQNTSNATSLTIAGKVLTDTLIAINVNHRLELRSNMVCTGTFDWQPGSMNTAHGYIYLNNSTNSVISGAATLFRLSNLTMNKSSGYMTEITASNFYLKGDASLAAALKPLTITTGILRLNTPPMTGSWMLNSGASPSSDFKITTNSALELYQGSAYCTATGTNAGVTLEGRLTLKPGTSTFIRSNSTTDSYLQHSTSTGTPTLEMGGDSLVIGGQFRSMTTGTARACSLTVSQGVMMVTTVNALVTTKSVFEVPLASYWQMNGGRIIVCRTSGMNPEVFVGNTATTVLTGGVFQAGHTNTPNSTTFRISTLVMPGFYLSAANGTATRPKATFSTGPVSFYGDVSTDAATVFTLSSDANYYGNLALSGTYAGSAYKAIFSGIARDQTLSSASALTVQTLRYLPTLATSQLTLSVTGDIATTDLDIELGTVNAGTGNIVTTGYITNYGTHASSTGILRVAGSSATPTITNGLTATYGNVEITRSVKSIGNMTLTGDLTLTTGVLDMDTSYLYLGVNSNILNGNATAFSGTKCIRTAGRVQDGGINKSFPSGAFTITFPIAVGATSPYSYVPATYTVTANTAPGTIGIKPVNRPHPATTDASNKELAFYWGVTSSGFAGLNLTHTYTYLPTMQNGRGAVTAYLPARYTGSWQTGIGTISVGSYRLNVNGTGSGVNFISGDYTAGEFSEFSNGATYLSNGTGGGDWDVASTWVDNVVPPTGSQVRIRLHDVVSLSINGRKPSTVTVDTNAVLDISSTTGHDFGTIYGQGTVALASPNFPSGNFGTFSSSGGGTVEYDGDGYTITSQRSVYNNLRINSTGTIDMANLATTVNGDLTVTQGTFRNLNNKKLIVRGNLLNGATFTAGSLSTNENLELYGNFTNNGTFTAGNTVTIFRGSTLQLIGGTQSPYFSTLQVNKPAEHLALTQSIQVGKQVTLTKGLIRLRRSNLSIWDTTYFKPDLITSASFVDAHMSGFVRRQLTMSASPAATGLTLFPVGDSLLYSPLSASIQSITIGASGSLNVNVAPSGHPQRAMANRYLKRYWRVQGTNLSSPVIDISYNYPASAELQDNYPQDPRPVTSSRYVGGEWENYPGWVDSTQTFNYPAANKFGDYTGGTGMGDVESLPITLASLTATPTPQGVAVSWTTLAEMDADGFGIERSTDGGRTFTRIGYVNSKAKGGTSHTQLNYTWLDKEPATGTNYYRLQQQDRDGETAASSSVQVYWEGSRLPKYLSVAPNPSDGRVVKAIFGGLMEGLTVATVTDALGHVIWKGVLEIGSRGELDLASKTSFERGVYMLTLATEAERMQVRFVVR